MNPSIISHSKDPVVAFACQEWSRMHERFGPLLHTQDGLSVHIDPWDVLLEKQASSKLAHTLSGARPKKDSYWIESGPEGIILGGQTPRSTLYAVYEAYRRYKGVHWVYPGEPAAVAAPGNSMPDGHAGELIEPLFERRGFVIENLYDPEYIADMIDWLAKNRSNEIFFTFTLWDKIKDVITPEIEKRGLQLTLGGHSMKFFLNRQEAESRRTADHPYTAKQQLDYSDDTWYESVFRDIADYCQAIPGLTRISLWPEDLPAGEDRAFLPLYIRFTEKLQDYLNRTLPKTLEVEHIAYNAGLAWNMLERGDTPVSDQEDVLLAYWGRDYRHPFRKSPAGPDQRAEQALRDWTREVNGRNRQLTVFEYYSDHFMLSPLFPSIPSMIVDDAAYYHEIGVHGLTNLIVPCPGYPDYPWKWATGMNSYAFARAVWGDSLESILDDYYSYYPAEDRTTVRTWMEAVEAEVTAVTAWNAPLFPGRVVDTARIPDNRAHQEDVASLLAGMHQRLKEAYGPHSGSPAAEKAGVYMRHLIGLTGELQRAWSGQEEG